MGAIGWVVTFGRARRGMGGGAAAPPSPFLAVLNVTAHPSTASVPITVLLYDGPLLCGFNGGDQRVKQRISVCVIVAFPCCLGEMLNCAAVWNVYIDTSHSSLPAKRPASQLPPEMRGHLV